MRIIFRLCFLTALAAFALLTSCSTTPKSATIYHVVAHKPHEPSKVRVAVSLSKQNVYVMEGDRCLMAAATSVGMNIHPTP
ncbi:MAG: L,D-transpeptidase, partial [Chthoniobacterales bacterium]|nr:L,D-transpeptidase [Chthoniobacterales bacterium]